MWSVDFNYPINEYLNSFLCSSTLVWKFENFCVVQFENFLVKSHFANSQINSFQIFKVY